MDNLQALNITQNLKPKFIIAPGVHENYLLNLNQLRQGDLEIQLIFVINQLSRLDLNIIGNGEIRADLKISIELVGMGSEATVVGAFLLNRQSSVQFNIKQNHLTSNAKSSVRIRTVLYEQTKFDYAGTIFIARNASGTIANQENKNMLLSEQAQVKSIPNIEVLNSDVQCGHGSAIGELDREQLLYLMSRGLEEKIAIDLLIESFLGIKFNN